VVDAAIPVPELDPQALGRLPDVEVEEVPELLHEDPESVRDGDLASGCGSLLKGWRYTSGPGAVGAAGLAVNGQLDELERRGGRAIELEGWERFEVVDHCACRVDRGLAVLRELGDAGEPHDLAGRHDPVLAPDGGDEHRVAAEGRPGLPRRECHRQIHGVPPLGIADQLLAQVGVELAGDNLVSELEAQAVLHDAIAGLGETMATRPSGSPTRSSAMTWRRRRICASSASRWPTTGTGRQTARW
jgi:hypothetical protein